MNHSIALHHFVLASTFAVLASGCLLKIDGLDAGFDETQGSDDDSNDESGGEQVAECLIGTEVDAVGVEQSSWDPGCGVVCAGGWGHDGAQLAIAWTSSSPSFGTAQAIPRAIDLLDDDRLVVARSGLGTVMLEFLEPDGSNIGGYDAQGLRSNIYGLELDSHVLYVTHGQDGDDEIELTAIDIGTQQQLWSRMFAGYEVSRPARGGGRIVVSIKSGPEDSAYELVAVDLDGGPLWATPTNEAMVDIAFSPSGDRIAAIAGTTRVFAAEDGALLDEFEQAVLPAYWVQSVTFADEDRVILSGSGLQYDRFEGWLASHSLIGGDAWEHIYNRADAWCPHENDHEYSAATAEFLGQIARLADGTLMVVGVEAFEQAEDEPVGTEPFSSHPWVARFSATGEFLGSDRGLWDGGAVDVVAGPDGAAYVLSVDNTSGDEDSPGYRVRKYVP